MGFFKRKFQRFRERLKQAERDLHYGSSAVEPVTWTRKLSDRGLCWMAEKIAEQRLLWHLRRCAEASLIYPDDLTESDTIGILKESLKRDADRHMRWMVFDGIAFLLTFVLLGPLFLLVPGIANLPAAYFAFRTVGHFLSMKGARQGLLRATWHTAPSEPLRELRRAITLEPAQRERRVLDIALQLRLERLATFFERTVVPGA